MDQNNPDYICHLKNVIYGFKQATRAWFIRLSHAITDLGFIESAVDHSLFVFHKDEILIYFLVYVDDIVVTVKVFYGIGSITANFVFLTNYRGVQHTIIYYFFF